MSFRLGSFIQAVTEQTYLDVGVGDRVVPAERNDQKAADQNPPDALAEDYGSDCSSEHALQTVSPKA
jgi:hypothetical protein